jgi:RimJ/RimL family protein N-acetyltransferase
MTQPRLATARLWLAPLGAADLDAVHALLTDSSVRRYLCDDIVLSREQVGGFVELSDRLFAEYGAGLWCVREREGQSGLAGLAGYFWFHDQLELLYALHPDRWGRGYATEASRAALAYGFDVCGFERAVTSTDAPNEASIRVMERLGLVLERRAVVDGLETLFYALDREAFVPGVDALDVVEDTA